MKKEKRIVIIGLVVLIIISIISVLTYRFLKDENKLTLKEKNYISDNRSNLIDVTIYNNANIFSNGGKGVFYDFLEDFEKDRNLTFNKIITEEINTNNGLTLTKGHNVSENSKIIYTDHYVLIGKENKSIIKISNIKETIGVLSSDVELINKFLNEYSLTIKNYEKRGDLEKGLEDGEVSYILVPNIEYLDYILDKLYYINYHFIDIKDYYYFQMPEDETLASILTKYINSWLNNDFNGSFNTNEYNLFTTKLKITEKEIDVINNREYEYGFVSNSPYDVKESGTYGGIISLYLNNFEDFSGITINYKKFNSNSKLQNAIKEKSLDLYINYNNYQSDYITIDNNYHPYISFIMSNSDTHNFTSIKALENYPVYTKENSFINTYLQNKGITTITYKKDTELKKILKNNNIVAMDYMNYILYSKETNDITERFRVQTDISYNFMSNADTMFNRLFTYYLMTFSQDEVMYKGLDNYNKTIKSSKFIYHITEYALIIIISIFLVFYIVYKLGKRVHIKKKIKKTDKMKYIDILTSLKNRNYLSENIPIWNQNTLYPQAIIVIDLNGIQELNDTYGYLEGDKQIQALANILIKTQLDNTEVIRTDGNEFTIYLVGYSEKQVLSYIKKLNKEFKSLPYDKNAAVGFSMITDDVKLIDDAINEATEMMKRNKQLYNEELANEKDI